MWSLDRGLQGPLLRARARQGFDPLAMTLGVNGRVSGWAQGRPGAMHPGIGDVLAMTFGANTWVWVRAGLWLGIQALVRTYW